MDIFLDKLHKNIEVHVVDVPATEFIRTISTTSQFLLPVPNDAANDIDYIIIDTHHYFDTTDRRVNNICHQRRLRRLCTFMNLSTLSYCKSQGIIHFRLFHLRHVAIILIRLLI